MADIIPARLLFNFEVAIHRFDEPPELNCSPTDWPDKFQIPALHGIDGREGFADVWLGWHPTGLYLGVHVQHKTRLPKCDAKKFWTGDNVRLMTDMRDTRDARRATRFCQHFYFLPSVGAKRMPVAGDHRIQRAQQQAPLVGEGRIPIFADADTGGWFLTAHLPADVLAGFDPGVNRRIGIFTIVEDSEHGQQFLTVGDDLNWSFDPSTWATGVLTD